MSRRPPNIAIFPGTFDPVTHGHLDIIRRAAVLFKKLIVAVGENPLKAQVFTPEERREMLVRHTAGLTNVEVQTYNGLTVDFAKQVGATVILRGIRDFADLHAELEIATANLVIGGLETVFLITSRQHIVTSSTLIKQIVEIGRYDPDHLSRLVPLDVAQRLEQRLRQTPNPSAPLDPFD
jgi:pantetheine-phosphate adenylyltransferase